MRHDSGHSKGLACIRPGGTECRDQRGGLNHRQTHIENHLPNVRTACGCIGRARGDATLGHPGRALGLASSQLAMVARLRVRVAEVPDGGPFFIRVARIGAAGVCVGVLGYPRRVVAPPPKRAPASNDTSLWMSSFAGRGCRCRVRGEKSKEGSRRG